MHLYVDEKTEMSSGLRAHSALQRSLTGVSEVAEATEVCFSSCQSLNSFKINEEVDHCQDLFSFEKYVSKYTCPSTGQMKWEK